MTCRTCGGPVAVGFLIGPSVCPSCERQGQKALEIVNAAASVDVEKAWRESEEWFHPKMRIPERLSAASADSDSDDEPLCKCGSGKAVIFGYFECEDCAPALARAEAMILASGNIEDEEPMFL